MALTPTSNDDMSSASAKTAIHGGFVTKGIALATAPALTTILATSSHIVAQNALEMKNKMQVEAPALALR
ncbi:MAG TPA: hypothetical protein VI522_05765 [Gammaproteobacteria bacterium]|nr:hypothetical protein [Gammaproteobacteria bacterium]